MHITVIRKSVKERKKRNNHHKEPKQKMKIPTLDNLVVNRCFFCLKDEEYVCHLHMQYSISGIPWQLVLSCFDIPLILPDSIKDILISMGRFWTRDRGRP